jgi:hypothetical protein
MKHSQLERPPDRLILCDQSDCEEMANCLELHRKPRRSHFCDPHQQSTARFSSAEPGISRHCSSAVSTVSDLGQIFSYHLCFLSGVTDVVTGVEVGSGRLVAV